MTKDKQFYAFLESLRTEENSESIGTIMEGYTACLEAGLLKKVGKAALPYVAAAGMLGGGAAVGAFDDSDLIEYEEQEHARMKYSTEQLSKLIQAHEAAIRSGDDASRARAYDALKKANVGIGYNQDTNFKYYHDKNLGRDFHVNGQEITGEERMDLPTL
jgi:hypothetical protein